jgi:dynein heavy chain
LVKVKLNNENNFLFYLFNQSLGQQIVAEEAMDVAAKEGHWVVLQNIHLG